MGPPSLMASDEIFSLKVERKCLRKISHENASQKCFSSPLHYPYLMDKVYFYVEPFQYVRYCAMCIRLHIISKNHLAKSRSNHL